MLHLHNLSLTGGKTCSPTLPSISQPPALTKGLHLVLGPRRSLVAPGSSPCFGASQQKQAEPTSHCMAPSFALYPRPRGKGEMLLDKADLPLRVQLLLLEADK